jgi:hypothetical protein
MFSLGNVVIGPFDVFQLCCCGELVVRSAQSGLAISGSSAQPVALARDPTHHDVFVAPLSAATGGRGRDFTCHTYCEMMSETKAEREKKNRAEEENNSLEPWSVILILPYRTQNGTARSVAPAKFPRKKDFQEARSTSEKERNNPSALFWYSSHLSQDLVASFESSIRHNKSLV